jgi:NADH dehydrogenase
MKANKCIKRFFGFPDKAMKIFVAGGAGFVGSHLVARLLQRGHEVTILVRTPGKTPVPDSVRAFPGNALEPAGLNWKEGEFDAVINLIGIIREFPSRGITYRRLHLDATRNLATAAKKAGIRRWIQMSANGAKANGVSEYQTYKFEAEEFLKEVGFEVTIFRPSLIFGNPPAGRSEFCSQMAGILRISPVVPLFGGGDYRLQPVHVEDVATAFASALEKPETAGKIFHIGGEKDLSYRKILDIICDGCGMARRAKMPVPYSLARPFIAVMGKCPLFPATVDQIDMLVEGNTVPETGYIETFGIKPTPFTAETLSYLRG